MNTPAARPIAAPTPAPSAVARFGLTLAAGITAGAGAGLATVEVSATAGVAALDVSGVAGFTALAVSAAARLKTIGRASIPGSHAAAEHPHPASAPITQAATTHDTGSRRPRPECTLRTSG